jgi:tRNA-modifying protein YgfZ
MAPLSAPSEQLTALAEGRAFADLSPVRTIRVTGTDARAWLHDLVTTDVRSLLPGGARRSLLLTPTGRIRADFMVGAFDDAIWLLQASDQPDAVDRLLAPYVLSSDVRLDDVGADHTVIAVLGPVPPIEIGPSVRPSIAGEGADLIVPDDHGDDRRRILVSGDFVPVGREALEVWRIRRGDPRLGVDVEVGALPAEAGLDDTIDDTKGCFLGQESVAKIRNFGHPPRTLRHLRTPARVDVGSIVAAGGTDAGVITSAAVAADGGTVVIASILWSARDAALTIADGVDILPVIRSD